ncbi:hypothetical protein PCASD_20000, partial [Puccinia coronata f. sp. avenae]
YTYAFLKYALSASLTTFWLLSLVCLGKSDSVFFWDITAGGDGFKFFCPTEGRHACKSVDGKSQVVLPAHLTKSTSTAGVKPSLYLTVSYPNPKKIPHRRPYPGPYHPRAGMGLHL